MIEIPEAVNYAGQLNNTVKDKHISKVEASHSPHKFAWYQGDPADYPALLEGKTIIDARSIGGAVEISADDVNIVLSEGAGIAFYPENAVLPKKRQLLINFEDGSALSVSVKMYGGILVFRDGEGDNQYYLTAREKPSPLSDAFDFPYFKELVSAEGADKLSAKALLATEQRIPGLGNGTLQDILYHAQIHPKRKVDSFTQGEVGALFKSLKRRDLREVRLVISDAHEGLQAAIKQVLTGAAWQRCTVHFMRHVLAQAARKDRKEVADALKLIFAQPKRDSAGAYLRYLAGLMQARFSKVAEMLLEAEEDILVHKTFPPEHQRSDPLDQSPGTAQPGSAPAHTGGGRISRSPFCLSIGGYHPPGNG